MTDWQLDLFFKYDGNNKETYVPTTVGQLLAKDKSSKDKKKKDAVYEKSAIKKTSSKKKKKDEHADLEEELKEYHGFFYGTGRNPWD